MRDTVRSFMLAYFLIPPAFYLMDALIHTAPDFRARIFVLQVLLLLAAVSSFVFILSASQLKIVSPFAAATGASLGLVHWFPIYLSLGAFFLWSTPAVRPPSSFWGDFDLLLMNLVFPVVTFSGATYDGSLLA